MKLVMDVGNSRIKWAGFGAAGLGPGAAVNRSEQLEAVLEAGLGDTGPPSDILICSVAGSEFNDQLERWMVARWGRRPGWFRSEPETMGIVNGYPEPAQLGADRWAAVIGARSLVSGPVGVIDCGTAATLDVLDGDDRHLGGLITPGLELAQQSLLTSTANVRAAAARVAGVLGRSTAECVANGTSLGLAGALERWMREVDDSVDGVAWLATGGGWPRVRATISRSIEYDPDLVLRGLARVLE
jgi:type III pantothenate kinase